MRKVLSFVLVLALVLGSFSMAFAATPAGGFSDTDAEAVSVLADLGVIDGYSDGTFKPANVVTRAEMAKLIIVALGLENFATATTSKYTDMAGAGWAQGYVAYATSLGIIEGYPGGTFGPSNPVTYNEACAMIVRALGYTADFLPGGWPAEWVVKAQTLGILDGVSAAGAAGATRGNIAEMLYNALELKIGYVNKDGDWVANVPTDTMLIRLGAEFIAAEDAENNGIITGKEDSLINLTPYIGAYADRYVNDDGDIIKVIMQSEFMTGEFDGQDTFTVDDVDYTLNAAAQADLFATTPSAVGFVNAETTTAKAIADDGTYTLAVDRSAKTIKVVYSWAEWNVTEDDMFAKTDASDIADDQELFGEEFVLDDNNDIDLNSFDLVGAKTLDDINVDNVVYVYSNTDGIAKIVVGTEVVKGEIDRISSSNVYTIDGVKYDLVDDANVINEKIDNLLTAGDDVTAYLDGFGNIYKLEGTTGETNYAISLDTGNGGTDLGDGPALVKLFLADGTSDIYDVKGSDVSLVGSDNVWNTVPDDGILVEYSLNSKGEVDSYDNTVAKTEVTKDITATGYYNGYKIADNAFIVSYDGNDKTDEDNYKVTSLASVKDTDDVTATYVLDSGKIVAMLITSGVGAEDVYGVITAYGYSSSDAGYYIEALVNGEEVTYDSNVLPVAVDKDYLQNFTFNTANEVTTFSAVTAGAEASIDTIDGYVVYDGDAATGTPYTLDDAVVIYKWSNSDGHYIVSSIRVLDDVDMWSELYDLSDPKDDVYDVVLTYVD